MKTITFSKTTFGLVGLAMAASLAFPQVASGHEWIRHQLETSDGSPSPSHEDKRGAEGAAGTPGPMSEQSHALQHQLETSDGSPLQAHEHKRGAEGAAGTTGPKGAAGAQGKAAPMSVDTHWLQHQLEVTDGYAPYQHEHAR